MIIYESTKDQFMNDVTEESIAVKIHNQFVQKVGRVSMSEINAWNNSMNYLYKVLNTPTIPDDVGVAIEYKVPASSRRIDFMITGLNDKDQYSVVIIELKQWTSMEAIEDEGNQEFIMIDDQKVVYEEALRLAQLAQSGKKQVLIVEGGPGTGKSVLGINLLVELTARDLVSQYVTKNSAPRAVYMKQLQQNVKKSVIDNLFKGSGVYYEALPNEFDCLIVDEAHRLNEKSGLFKNKGINQTMEIIRAARFSVFFIDEYQKIAMHDVGS